MKNIIEWSLVRERLDAYNIQWILVCKTSDQEMIRFCDHNPFKTFDKDSLIGTDFHGCQYQFDRVGYVNKSCMTDQQVVYWIIQYLTQGKTPLFTYIGREQEDYQIEFRHVTLSVPIGDFPAGTAFDCATMELSHKGLELIVSNRGDMRSIKSFTIDWVMTGAVLSTL